MAEVWQEELKSALHSFDEKVETRFRTLVPPYYLKLINRADPNDPIAKMALPSTQELLASEHAMRDPIGDLAKQAAPRLTHRYPDRALLHVTNLCPMYCRFCFRKNLMNEKEEELYVGNFSAAAAYVATHPEIVELILSGGDPWMLSDQKLAELLDLFSKAPQLRTMRFHTRMPVTLPSRITDNLIRILQRPERWQTIIVTHFNHPNELSPEAAAGIQRLHNAGILVLNQSVLLRGVNDQASTLQKLFRELGAWGVLPYYLHHCDLVSGAEHFRTSIAAGKKIWQELRGTIPGYLLPEYIMEIPGGGGKIPVAEPFVKEIAAGQYRLSRNGVDIEYCDPVT